MTLDEAIEHAEWCAKESCGECAEEHRQLAEWLKELRERQDVDAEMEDERNLLVERLGNCREALTDARAENEQYRELIRVLDHDWNIEASWDGLRKFWYVGLTEKGVAERDERDAENAKLREMAAQALQIIKHVNVVMAIDYARYGALMGMARELGIEVDE